MKIKWLGHACFFLDGSKKILIDPFMPYGDFGCAKSADLVAVTHGHGDHFGETTKLRKRTICNFEISNYLKSLGIQTESMGCGGTIKIDEITVTMTPALHSSSIEDLESKTTGIYGGLAGGFIIKMNDKTIYHAGDTGLFSDMKLIHDLYHPDVALLPVGDRFTMGPDEAMIAAEYIGAPIVIPMHYNTYPAIAQDLTQFKSAIERVTVMKVIIMSPGEEIDI